MSFRFAIAVILCFARLAATAAPLGDAPTRVGRISLVEGDAAWRNDYSSEARERAIVNWPVATGNVITTSPDSRLEIEVGTTSVRLDSNTELEVARLDDEQMHFRLLSGSLFAEVRSAEHVGQFRLMTPQGQITPSDIGAFRVDASPQADSTVLTVMRGGTVFSSPSLTFSVKAGERAEIRGAEAGYRTTAVQRDDFDVWNMTLSKRETAASRYLSPEIAGQRDLADYGAWMETPEYGSVWYPYGVPAGWAPYSVGRWAWIRPWGWTWIDFTPWGFAPFHYGRWVWIRGGWAWVPGNMRLRPAFAPALVSWLTPAGWTSQLASGPALGWIPLAPGEPFVPVFPCGPRCLERFNAHARFRDPPASALPVNRAIAGALTVAAAPLVAAPFESTAGSRRHVERMGGSAIPRANTMDVTGGAFRFRNPRSGHRPSMKGAADATRAADAATFHRRHPREWESRTSGNGWQAERGSRPGFTDRHWSRHAPSTAGTAASAPTLEPARTGRPGTADGGAQSRRHALGGPPGRNRGGFHR